MKGLIFSMVIMLITLFLMCFVYKKEVGRNLIDDLVHDMIRLFMKR